VAHGLLNVRMVLLEIRQDVVGAFWSPVERL